MVLSGSGAKRAAEVVGPGGPEESAAAETVDDAVVVALGLLAVVKSADTVLVQARTREEHVVGPRGFAETGWSDERTEIAAVEVAVVVFLAVVVGAAVVASRR